MAFVIPPIKTLAQTVRNAFKSEMPGTDAWVWPNNLYVTAKVFAGLVWGLYGRLKQIDRDRFVTTAQGAGLLLHGAEYGITLKQATYATGAVDIIGVPLAVVPLGTVFTRSDGIAYTSNLATAYSTAGTATIFVTCSSTGPAGNSIFGAKLTTPDPNTTSAAVNEAGIGQGTTVETWESLRARILRRKRNVPMGGAAYDYEAWALMVPGVTRAWTDSGALCGLGRVTVYFLMDSTYPSNYGLPQPTDVAAVEAFLLTVAPVTAGVTAACPVPFPLDVTVSGLSPSTPAMRQAASDEIYNVVYRNAAVSTSSAPLTSFRSWFWQAVASVSGETSFEIASPATNLSLPIGSIPVVRSVTFI
jgi:uncharacterized phage protein gp47/JayE